MSPSPSLEAVDAWAEDLTAHLKQFPFMSCYQEFCPVLPGSLIKIMSRIEEAVFGTHALTKTPPTLCLVVVLFLVPLLLLINFGPLQAPKVYRVSSPRVTATTNILSEAGIKVTGDTRIRCYAPATGQLLGYVTPSTPADIDKAIAQAAAAQKSWAKTSFAQRKAVLRAMLRHVLDNQEEICRVSSLDSGKTMIDAQLGEIMVTAEKLQWTIKHGAKALQPSKRPTNFLLSYKKATVHYEPLGVVSAIVSWNYPFHNLIGPIISSIFAGNGIVVKVSEQTCWSAEYYTNIARGALKAYGHDPNLIQTVVCWPEIAGHLTSHPDISHLTFIGSRPVCHHVAASAARSLTPMVAELGGKDAAIILDTASRDLPRIVEVLLRGTFQASGQNCIGIERIIATPKIYPTLVSTLAPRVRNLRLGLDKDVGAMISNASFTRLENLIQDAVASGARLLAGGKRYHHPDHPHGFYFEPTLLVDVTSDMAIANEECFGPIMTLMKAPSSSASDILTLANAPNFGLGASVYGSNDDPTLQTIVDRIRAGGVAVNDFAVFYAVQLPFGGVGGSGYGRFAGEEGLRGLCNIKSVCEDRFGGWGIRTAIPGPARYPIASQEKGWRFTKGVVSLGYGLTVGDFFGAVMDILRNL